MGKKTKKRTVKKVKAAAKKKAVKKKVVTKTKKPTRVKVPAAVTVAVTADAIDFFGGADAPGQTGDDEPPASNDALAFVDPDAGLGADGEE